MAATHDKDFGQQLESALFHGVERKKRTGTRKETYARMETVMNNAEKKDKKISSTRARRFYLDFVECGLGFIC